MLNKYSDSDSDSDSDDTTLLCNLDNIRNENPINNKINNIYNDNDNDKNGYKWLCSNKLSLNVSKTK